MFTHLPDPYPEETVHSLCSRHAHYLKLNPRDTSLKLFGTNQIGSYVDLPLRIDQLLQNFRNPTSHTVEILILDHTTAPFYITFWSRDRASRLLSAMGFFKQPNHTSLDSKGLFVSFEAGNRVRFCLECASDQRAKYGEAYWLRLHQIAGVQVCPIHKTYLIKSSIRFSSGAPLEDESQNTKSRGFYYPDHHARISPESKVRKGNPDAGLIQYSLDAQWILENRFSASQSDSIHRRLWLVLARKGYSIFPPSQQVLHELANQLRSVVTNHFSEEELQELGRPLTTDNNEQWANNWLAYVLPNQYYISYDPIRIWLLIRALGMSMEEFWKIPEAGCEWHSPYPCLSFNCPNFWENKPYNQPCLYRSEKED